MRKVLITHITAMRFTHNFKLSVNLFFLFSATVFTCFLLAALTHENLLNEFGHSYREHYVLENQKLIESALNELAKGHDQKVLELLQEQFADIRKGDRIYPHKRRLLQQLVAYLYQQKNQNWIVWTEVWWELDPRDVSAMIYHNLALLQSEKGYTQGSDGLQKLKKAYPTHHLWSETPIPSASTTQLLQ